MGEHSAFSETGRALSPDDIAVNFDDLHAPLNAQEASVQASRCLFCFDAPCVTACPTAIDIPKFIRQIATGNKTGAAKTILSANIMGGTCARACPTEILCEQKCVLEAGEHTPVLIGHLQRHAVDHLMRKGGNHPFVRAPQTGKTMAVIGAGPAGLSCAHALALMGHGVTVFEAKPKPGGLNEYGLAAYKMAGGFAAREADFIMSVGGITIEYGKALGRDVMLGDLQKRFDAVFLGVGLGRSRELDVEGAHLGGVVNALTFIEDIRQADDLTQLDPGQNVVVIGGGNTAIDVSVQAKRLGAQNVTLVYRRGPGQMGATAWEQDLAATNGVAMVHWARPVRLIGEAAVHTVHFERTQLVAGKLEGMGEFFDVTADRVFKAVGQELVDDGLAGLQRARGKVVVDEAGQTSIPDIFAGGDCVRSGEDLTVQAVADGNRAALGIAAFMEAQNG